MIIMHGINILAENELDCSESDRGQKDFFSWFWDVQVFTKHPVKWFKYALTDQVGTIFILKLLQFDLTQKVVF